MRLALGDASHELLCPSLHFHLIVMIVKQSEVESGTKTPPTNVSCPWACSGLVSRGHRGVCGVCLFDKWPDKRKEVSKEGSYFLLLFPKIIIYTVVSKIARYLHRYLITKCFKVWKCCRKYNTHVLYG